MTSEAWDDEAAVLGVRFGEWQAPLPSVATTTTTASNGATVVARSLLGVSTPDDSVVVGATPSHVATNIAPSNEPLGVFRDETTIRDVNVVNSKPEPAEEAPNQKDDNNEEPPEHFLCPITHELMTDPVRTPHGHSFQRSAIVEWLTKPGSSCPMTRKSLSSLQLDTNQALRLEIRQWQIQRGVQDPIPLKAPPQRPTMQKEMETFLLFLRVLIKYLEHTKSPNYSKVKSIIQRCADRKKRGNPCHVGIMRQQLQAVVPAQDWNKAAMYVRQLLAMKHNTPRAGV